MSDGPEARKRLEKENPALVKERDQAVVEQKRERLERELAARSARKRALDDSAFEPQRNAVGK